MTSTVTPPPRSIERHKPTASLGKCHLPAQRARAWTAAQYRETFGWAIADSASETRLELGQGIVAMSIAAMLGPRVAAELAVYDPRGPLMLADGNEPRWVFLADPNGMIVTDDDLPLGASVHVCPSTVPIPSEKSRPENLRWIVPPDPRRRWLPTLAALTSAITRTAQRPVTSRSGVSRWTQ